MALKIVFVEAAAEPFGSSRSLFTLMTHLNRDRFEPLVACNQHNELVSWCRDAGLTVMPLSLPGASNHKVDSKAREEVTATPKLWNPSFKERALLHLRMLRDRRKYARPIAELKRFAAVQDANVIHCNNQPSTNQFAYLARGNRPLVQHLRDAPLTRSLHMEHLSKACKHLFSISDFVRDDAISALRLDPQNISTLYNPIGDEFSFDPEVATLQRRKWGIAQDEVVFGMAGRIIPWKGVNRTITAFKNLRRDPQMEKKARLVIVGASDTPTDYEIQCRQLAGDLLGKSIQIHPFTKDVAKVFNGFDVVLHPILKPEGFGRVIIEGMACGAPPLGRKLGALRELITDGQNGHLFLEDAELVQLMRSVITDPASFNKMKEKAMASADRFRPTALVQDFEKTYTKLFLNNQIA
ncbi:MAG: glycosyltransferase family 4 protein [Hyphomicrobiales bacterium]